MLSHLLKGSLSGMSDILDIFANDHLRDQTFYTQNRAPLINHGTHRDASGTFKFLIPRRVQRHQKLYQELRGCRTASDFLTAFALGPSESSFPLVIFA